MTWTYEHMPVKVNAYHFEGGKFINSVKCPKNNKRPCIKSGPCCLGTNKKCQQNKCHNIDASINNPLEGF